MTVDTGDILINASIRTKDPINLSYTETGTLSKMVALTQVVQEYERAVIFRLGRLLSGGSRGPGEIILLSRGPGEEDNNIPGRFLPDEEDNSDCFFNWSVPIMIEY